MGQDRGSNKDWGPEGTAGLMGRRILRLSLWEAEGPTGTVLEASPVHGGLLAMSAPGHGLCSCAMRRETCRASWGSEGKHVHTCTHI